MTAISVSPATASITVGTKQQLTATAHYSDDTTADVTSSATWTGSNASIATVSAAGIVTPLASGSATITASIGTASGSATISVLNAAKIVSVITISPDNATVAAGATQSFKAVATYTDASTANVTSSVTWTSSNKSVATISAAGIVTAVATGSATITATLSGVSSTATITVPAPTKSLSSIALTPGSATIAIGATQQFDATATYSDGSTADVTASAAWSSSASVATVGVTGLATAVSAGSATITATLSGISGSATLTVPAAAPTLTAITVSPATASIVVSGTQQFSAVGTYSDGSTASVTATAAWTVANPAVAGINPAGLANGIANGTTSVIASIGTVTGSAMLTVGTSITSIAVTPNPASLAVGATQQFTATATYADGSTGNITSSATWTVVNPAIATITSAGLATGVASGPTTVTASLNGVTGSAALTGKSLTSIAISPGNASFTMGATQQFTATATYNDSSTADVTSTATWSIANTAVATITSAALATGVASGSSSVTASIGSINSSVPILVTVPVAQETNVVTWHFDTSRTGLNPGETSLTPTNVAAPTFGKLFSYLVDGYAYAEPLLVSNVTINGAVHNVLYVATENDSVYAFDADNYGSGAPLWKTSLLQSGETPLTNAPIKPYTGTTSTPVIDPTTNTIYVVSQQTSSSAGPTYRLNALDITTGAAKTPAVTITASVHGTNSSNVGGIVSLPPGCIQRAALLLSSGTIYMGFGSCHEGWLLAYDAQTLQQDAVFSVSPNLDGEGPYASAGGVWMGSGGPVADSAGNVYISTGNGPYDGASAWSDSMLKFNPKLAPGPGGSLVQDAFTPVDYLYMDCQDSDLAAGGLMMIPGTGQIVGGGKMGKLYMVNTAHMGGEQNNDAGVTSWVYVQSPLDTPYTSAACPYDPSHPTATVNSYEIFGTAAYFNGSIYLGVTPTNAAAAAGVRHIQVSSGQFQAAEASAPSIQQNTRGTTPFISANGTSDGVLWMIDEGQPLGTAAPTSATLRAYDPLNLASELYDSNQNPGDVPGYGIKFSSPIVANGKVYISTGHDLTTATNPQGEIDVYGLK